MATAISLVGKLEACPPGRAGWREFEESCVELLTELFVPPLEKPKTQARSFSGIDRRDAVFPNRNNNGNDPWSFLFRELGTRLLPVEFKNYEKAEIGKEEVDQTRAYLRSHWGRLALIVSNTEPTRSALVRRNTIFTDAKVVILFLSTADLREMAFMKERGADPANFILDLLDEFYLQHE